MVSFEVAFLPSDARRKERRIYVLVDVLRATSSIVRLIDNGCSEIILAGDAAAAAAAKRSIAGALLCAENADGSRADGAEISPSLRELSDASVAGKTVILLTTNGTRAAQDLRGRPGICLAGSLMNARGVMRAATTLAVENDLPIAVVCSGRERTKVYALDDAYCAGFLVNEGIESLRELGQPATSRDSAKLALDILAGHPSSYDALAASESAAVLRRIGCAEDIALAARRNISIAVPVIAAGAQPDRLSVSGLTDPATIRKFIS